MQTRKILTLGLALSLIIVFVVYAGIEAKGIFFGPKIDLYSPAEGTTVQKPIIQMSGQSFRTKELTINGNQTLIDMSGKFSVNLVLSPGYNIITIVATDARGAQHTTTRHLYFESEELVENGAKVEDNSTSTDTNMESSTTASSSYQN